MSKNQNQPAAPAGEPKPEVVAGAQAPAAEPAPAPTPTKVVTGEGTGFICLEAFTHNDVSFAKGEAITAEKLAKIDGPTKQRRMQNGFIGFAA